MKINDATGRLFSVFGSSWLIILSITAYSAEAGGVQVSDKFTKAAKLVGRQYVAESLKKVCGDSSDNNKVAFCEAFVEILADLFDASIDGNFDAEAIQSQVDRVAVDAAVAAIINYTIKDGVGIISEKLFDPYEKIYCPEVAEGEKEKQECLKWRETIEITESALTLIAASSMIGKKKVCGNKDADGKRKYKDQLERLGLDNDCCTEADFVKEAIKAINEGQLNGEVATVMKSALEIAEELMNDGLKGKNYSHAAFNFIQKVETKLLTEIFKSIASLSSERQNVLNDINVLNNINNVMASADLSDEVESRLREFTDSSNLEGQINELISLAAIGDSAVFFKKLAEQEPDISNLSMLTKETNKKLEKLTAKYKEMSASFQFPIALQELEIPILLGGIMLDYLVNRDDSQLERNLKKLLIVIYKLILKQKNDYLLYCVETDPNSGNTVCRFKSGDKKEHNASNSISTDLATYKSSLNQDSFCQAQLMEIILSDGLPTKFPGNGEIMCQMAEMTDELKRKFDQIISTDFITKVNGNSGNEIYAWKIDKLKFKRLDIATIDFSGIIDEELALDLMLEMVTTTIASGSDTEREREIINYALFAAEIIKSLENGNRKEAFNIVLAKATEKLTPVVDKFVEDIIPDKVRCVDDDLLTSVQVLSRSLFSEAMEIASGRKDIAEVSKDGLIDLKNSDWLASTPFIIDVGLGYNLLIAPKVTNNGERANHEFVDTSHLTLLDKWGLGAKFGDVKSVKKAWQFGIFVGGFLDAIIRQIGGKGTESHWLMGFNLGIRKFSRSFPLGLEVHAAWAPPSDFPGYWENYNSWAMGLTILVPYDVLLEL